MFDLPDLFSFQTIRKVGKSFLKKSKLIKFSSCLVCTFYISGCSKSTKRSVLKILFFVDP